MTISPQLLEELANDTGSLERVLSPDNGANAQDKWLLNETQFRFALNEDAMATEKLAEGIRGFTKDTLHLEKLLKQGL